MYTVYNVYAICAFAALGSAPLRMSYWDAANRRHQAVRSLASIYLL